MPRLFAGMWRVSRDFNMPTTSVAMTPNVAQ